MSSECLGYNGHQWARSAVTDLNTLVVSSTLPSAHRTCVVWRKFFKKISIDERQQIYGNMDGNRVTELLSETLLLVPSAVAVSGKETAQDF